MVQSKSDTRMKRYGLFNTEAAIAEVEQLDLQIDLKGFPEARRRTERLINSRDGLQMTACAHALIPLVLGGILDHSTGDSQ